MKICFSLFIKECRDYMNEYNSADKQMFIILKNLTEVIDEFVEKVEPITKPTTVLIAEDLDKFTQNLCCKACNVCIVLQFRIDLIHIFLGYYFL